MQLSIGPKYTYVLYDLITSHTCYNKAKFFGASGPINRHSSTRGCQVGMHCREICDRGQS